MRAPLRRLLPRLGLVLASLASAGVARGQDGGAQLVVVVTDSAGAPVAGARVEVSGLPSPVLSDSAGRARAAGVPLGTRLVTVRHPAYREERALLQFPSAATYRLPVVLTPAAVALDTLHVVGERGPRFLEQNGFNLRRRRGMGTFLTREELDRLPAGDLVPAFRLVPGFRVHRTPQSIVLTSARGSTSLRSAACEPLVRIDGVPADGELLATLLPRDVEAIETYASPASVPVEYSYGKAECGLVLVWLRR